MSGPQIIRTPSGEELVVLSRAEYEALLERADHAAEDADDVAIYDARKAELAAGGDGIRHSGARQRPKAEGREPGVQ
jgi:PHD/YefM family antitoxin component YafN of YafNO toxin-antitoxin module